MNYSDVRHHPHHTPTPTSIQLMNPPVSPRTSSQYANERFNAKSKSSSISGSAKFSRHHKQKMEGVLQQYSTLANFHPSSQAIVPSLMQATTISPPSMFTSILDNSPPHYSTTKQMFHQQQQYNSSRKFFTKRNGTNTTDLSYRQPQFFDAQMHHQPIHDRSLVKQNSSLIIRSNPSPSGGMTMSTSSAATSSATTGVNAPQINAATFNTNINNNNNNFMNNNTTVVAPPHFRITQNNNNNNNNNNAHNKSTMSSSSMHDIISQIKSPFGRPSSASGRSLNSSGFPLKYMGKQRASEILRMGELIDYLLSKGYTADASDAFYEFVIHSEQSRSIMKLIVDESPETAEQCAREITVLFKLCSKFTAHALQQQQSPVADASNKAFTLLKFQQKLLEILCNRKEPVFPKSTLAKFKATFYSNLGIYSLKQDDYQLALTYFRLSLSMFNEDILSHSPKNSEKNAESEANRLNHIQQHFNDISIEESTNKLHDNNNNNSSNNNITATASIFESIVLNNLAMVHAMMSDFETAEQLLLRSIAISEAEIFTTMRKVATRYLRRDSSFLESLPVLIYGYVYYEAVQRQKEIYQQSQSTPPSTPIASSRSSASGTSSNSQFMKNATSLCKKFLGSDHPFSLRIHAMQERFNLKKANHNQGSTDPQQQQSQQQQQQFSQTFNAILKPIGSDPIEENTDSTDSMLAGIFPFKFDAHKLQAVILYQRIHAIEITASTAATATAAADSLLQDQPNAAQINEFLLRQNQKISPTLSTTTVTPITSFASPILKADGRSFADIIPSTESTTKPSRKVSEQQQQQQQQSMHVKENQDLKQEVTSLKASIAQLQEDIQTMQKQQAKNKQQQNAAKGIEQSQEDLSSSSVGLVEADMNIMDISQINNQTTSGMDSPLKIQLDSQSIVQQATTMPQKDEQWSTSNGSIKPSNFKKQSNNANNNTNHHNAPITIDAQLQQIETKVASLQEFKEKFEKQMQQQQQQPPVQAPQSTNMKAIPALNLPIKTQPFPTSNADSSAYRKQEAHFRSDLKHQQSLQQTVLQSQQSAPQPSSQQPPQPSPHMRHMSQKVASQSPRISNSHHSPGSSTPPPTAQSPSVLITRIIDCISRSSHTLDFSLKRLISVNPDPTSNAHHTIRCGIRYDKSVHSHMITMSAISSEGTISDSQTIPLNVFAELLRYVCYQDVLPATMPVDSISCVSDICKFFILPFIGLDKPAAGVISTSKSQSPPQQIKVFPRAQGILPEYHKIEFLSAKVLVQLNHIEGQMFRISICEADSARKNLRIDLEYDDTSFKGMFTVTQKDEFVGDTLNAFFECTHASDTNTSLAKEIVHREIVLEKVKNLCRSRERTQSSEQEESEDNTDETEDENNQFQTGRRSSSNGTPSAATILKNRKQFSSQAEEYYIQSVRATDYETFIAHLSMIIREVERVFIQYSTHQTLDSASEDLAYFKVKVYQGLKKSMLIICSDASNSSASTQNFTTVDTSNEPTAKVSAQSMQQQSGVRVQLYNFFDSFSPAGKKIKEKGEAVLTAREISRIYGINYSSEQSLQILTLCSYHFNLRVIEKVSDTSMNARDSSNYNILRIPTVSGGQSTVLFRGADGFIFPLTFEIVGAKEIFLGVKIALYNPDASIEQCIFLTTHHASWVFQNEILAQKYHHFATDMLPLANYFITHIFNNVAVPVLQNALQIENTQTNVSPTLVGARGFPKNVLRLEALLNPAATRTFFIRAAASTMQQNR